MGLKLNGATSGSIEIDVPAVAGTDTAITIPATTGGEFIVSDSNGNIDLGPLDINGGASDDSVNIDGSGRLLVGTSSSPSLTDGQYAKIHLVGNTAGATGDSVLNLGRGALASSGIAADTSLGILQFTDSAGAAHATIKGVTDAATGSNDYPGRLVFSTTPDAASSPTERCRISSDGKFRMLGSSDAARIVPNTDNVGYLGESVHRWQAVYAVNGTIQTSDFRQKTDIKQSTLGSDFIKALNPVSYKWIEGGKEPSEEVDENGNPIFTSVPGLRTHWGFIAQEVKQAVDDAGVDFGGWVLTDKDDPDSEQALRYDQFIAPLTKALQEALDKIETLETANASQAATIAALDARLTALEGGAS